MPRKPIACVIDSYGELIAAIERQRIASALSHAEIEHRAGLASGHYSKILGYQKHYGRHVSMQSLIWLLLALGLELRVFAVGDVKPGDRMAHMARTKRAA